MYQRTKKRYCWLGSYPRKSRHCGALVWDCRYPSPPPWRRPSRKTWSAFLSLSPSLHLPENILHCSNDSGSDIVDFGMQAPSIFHPWFSQSKTYLFFDKQLPCAYINETPAHCSLCIAIVTYVLLCGHLTKIPLPSPSKTPTPKLNSRARPCFWSWLSQIRDHHQHAISCRFLPLLRQNWSPRDKVPWLGSGLLIGSALFLLLGVCRALKVGRWRDQHPNPGVVTQGLSEEEEKDNLSQGDTMPGSFEPARRDPSVPWTEVVGKNLDDFSNASSCKVGNAIFVTSNKQNSG